MRSWLFRSARRAAAYFRQVKARAASYGAAGWWLLLPVVAAWAGVSALGYEGLNGQDAYDYLRIAKEWTHGLHGGPKPAMAEHPHGYPIVAAVLGSVVGSPLLGLRLISAFGLGAIILLVRRILLRPGNDLHTVNAFALIGIALCPFLLRHAMVAMSDVATIALLLASLLLLQRWLVRRSAVNLVLTITFMVLALSFRLAAAPIVLVMLAWCLWSLLPPRVFRLLVALASVLLLLTAAWWWPRLSAWAGHGPLAEWSAFNLFRTELHSDDGMLRYRFPNLVYVLSVFVHPGFLPIGALLIPFLRWSDLRLLESRISLSIVAVYLLFIAGMPFQNDRVLLLIQPFVALLFYPAFQRAAAFVQKRMRHPAVAVAVLALVQTGLFIRAVLPFVRQAETERVLAEQLNRHSATRIYTHGMGAALDELCPQAEITELWYAELDSFQSGAYVVVDPVSLADQWQGRAPALNWQRAQEQGLEQVASGPGRWVVARVR